MPLYNEIFYFENYKLIAIDGQCKNCCFNRRKNCSNLDCTGGDKRAVIFKVYEIFKKEKAV